MPAKSRVRDKDVTRSRLLHAGFEEVYAHGFQSASVDRILERLELTKGAFFHHFPTKQAFGYALVDETIADMIRAQWVEPLARSDDPLTTIAESFEVGVRALEAAPLNLGCPLNNLAQEMSPLDQGFRLRTQQVFELWMSTYELALRRGQASGVVKPAVDSRAAAFSLVAEIEGILSLSRNSQDTRVLRHGLQNLKRQLEALRVAAPHDRKDSDVPDRPSMPNRDPDTDARFRAALPPNLTIVIRPMFGQLAAFVNGHMFAGTFGRNVFVRLNADDRRELLAVPGATAFAPMASRPMTEYVQLPGSSVTDRMLQAWLVRSFAWAATLSPKAVRKRSRATARNPRRLKRER